MTIEISEWVIRERRGVAHLVESLISGDAVTRCGRRLRFEPTKTGGHLAVVDSTLPGGGSRCVLCDR